MADDIDLVQIHQGGDYGSEFEYDSEIEKKTSKRKDLADPKKSVKTKLVSKQEVSKEYEREENRRERFHFLTLDAFSRHKKFINDYMMYYGGTRADLKRDSSRDKTDMDVVREHHQFLWDEDEDEEDSWEKKIAKKYYSKLFKEYCIADLSRYKENKIAMRWRIEKEVVIGKGQFMCGNKQCNEQEGLRTWEVNFGYLEHGEKKNALVKLRLCPECSHKLNYHHRRKEVIKQKERKKEKKSKRRLEEDTDCSSKKSKDNQDDRPDSAPGSEEPSPGKSAEGDKTMAKDGNIWSGPAKIVEEKSRAEEFDAYFEDMFL